MAGRQMKTLTLKVIFMLLVLLGLSPATRVHATPPLLPDFIITSLSIAPMNAVEGMPITVTATVKNQGDAAGYGRYLDVWVNTNNYSPVFGEVGDWWIRVESLEPGASRTIVSSPTYVRSPGRNQLFACIEFENLVSEKNNTNNCFSLGFEAEPIESLLAPVYRFWSPVFGGHFYTMNEEEKNNIIGGLSAYWTYEGVAYDAYTRQPSGTLPVYRFWSPVFAGHFYTMNEEERNNISGGLSAYWTYEGVAWYAYPTQVAGTVPIYRFWSSRLNHHFFTASEEEKNNVIASLSAYWTYEGVAYYAFSSRSGLNSGAMDSLLNERDEASAQNSTAGAAAEPPSITLKSDKAISERTTGNSGVADVQWVIPSDYGDLVFPLSYPGHEVAAYVYDSVEDSWRCVLAATNSPEMVVLKNAQSNHRYLLEVFVGDPDDSTKHSVHRSWLDSQLDPPDEINKNGESTMDVDGVGSPVVRLVAPAADSPLTVKLYSASQGVVQTLSGVSGGDRVELPLSEWNRWYWVGGWRDSDNELVLSIWLRHETDE